MKSRGSARLESSLGPRHLILMSSLWQPVSIQVVSVGEIQSFFFSGFSIFKSATVSFRAVGVNGKVLQEEWESSEQPKAFKGIVSVGKINLRLMIHLMNSQLFSQGSRICFTRWDPTQDWGTTQWCSKWFF